MLFAIALGGALGTVARYLLGGFVQRASDTFPYGTLVVNVTGSFLLGFLVRYLLETTASPELRAVLAIGFCGGYTTFSTFSYETIQQIQQGEFLRAGGYVAASLVAGLVAVVIGIVAARAL